jgi:hypothetical protein
VRTAAGLFTLLALAACSMDSHPTAPDGFSPAFAKPPSGGGGGSTTLYQLQFVDESTLTIAYDHGVIPPQGEITSPTFPAGGISMNTKDPWRSVSVPGIGVIELTEPTHADLGSSSCNPPYAATVKLVSAADPSQGGWSYPMTGYPSFAGSWTGDLTISAERGGGTHGLGFAGYRTGSVDQSDGAIQNVLSQGNTALQWRAADDSWFLIRFTNAPFAFGSASTPDGVTPYSAPGTGKKLGCANFAVLATRMN